MSDRVVTPSVYVSGGDEEFSHETTTFGYRTAKQIEDDELKRTEMISWLRANSVDHRPAYERALALRAPGTFRSFLESGQYSRWRTEETKSLACVGPLGNGKTVLR
jgi:hypothetical protein